MGIFQDNNPQPNAMNQAIYKIAKDSFDLAVSNLQAALPGLLATYQKAFSTTQQSGMDVDGAMDKAWTALQTAQHTLNSDVLTYGNQLDGWRQTWFTNPKQATSFPPELPDSLKKYVFTPAS